MTMKINRIMAVLLLAVATALAQHTGGGGSGTGGGGSGTVSANNGSAGAVANYPAAAGSTTVSPTTLIWSPNTLTLGSAGGGNAVLALPGNTSGQVTLTAPAVAGTNTNGLALSNVLVVPLPAAGPSYSVSGQTAQGFGDDGTIWGPGAPTVWVGANARGLVVFNGITIPTVGSLGWATSNINGNASIDTKLSRSAVGTVSFDTSTTSNGLGALTNCRTIVNVTPVTANANVATDQNLMAA